MDRKSTWSWLEVGRKSLGSDVEQTFCKIFPSFCRKINGAPQFFLLTSSSQHDTLASVPAPSLFPVHTKPVYKSSIFLKLFFSSKIRWFWVVNYNFKLFCNGRLNNKYFTLINRQRTSPYLSGIRRTTSVGPEIIPGLYLGPNSRRFTISSFQY